MGCNAKDIVDSYTPCKNNKRYRQQAWREPITCDQVHAAVHIGGGQVEVPCDPCQPNEHRPDGGRCVPKFVECGQNLHAVMELVVNSWHAMPRNFSKEVWILREDLVDQDPSADFSDNDDPNGHNWQLSPDARFIYTGHTAAGGGQSSSQPGEAEPDHFGNALLHLDVELIAEGQVHFFVEVFPPSAWEQEATFLIDNVAAQIWIVHSHGSLVEVIAPLTKGLHRLTWSWEYHAGSGDHVFASHDVFYRLLNVTVVHAKGAGASRCEACGKGEEVAADGHGCKACRPGYYLDSDKHRCQQCPQNTYAAGWGNNACTACGPGTQSAPGEVSCKPTLTLQVAKSFIESSLSVNKSAPSFVSKATMMGGALSGEPLEYNVNAIAEAWREATGGVSGPFAVDGRQFVLGLFNQALVPGVSDSDTAFAWVLLQQHSVVASSNEASCPGRSAEDYQSLGNILAYVKGVAWGLTRGISVAYGNGEPCSSGELRHATIILLCSVEAAFNGEPAHKDSLGLYQLNGLRLSKAKTAVGHEGSSSTCSNVTLEWATRAACPRCRRADYAPTVGLCNDDGYRDVTFSHQEACIGGVSKPKPYQEKCDDDTKAKDKMKHIVAIVVVSAVLLLIALCSYACYLHKKYAKYVPEL